MTEFDFGMWESKPSTSGSYCCNRHGPQESGLLMRVNNVNRKYCAECLIELLDKYCSLVEETHVRPED
jgi:hypothetical protein